MSETSGIGRTLRQIRLTRGKSLSVIAGLAGISPSYLSRLESGERALDRRSLIVSLANALEVAPSEITGSGIAKNVGVWRMSIALEAGEHADAVKIATTVKVDALPSPTRKSAYYREYGRALARLPKRRDDAVMMLRQAERISPARIHRHPFMRSVLAELLARAKRDAVGRELRGMAYRAGLPV